LEDQLREVEERAEHGEREVAKLDTIVAGVRHELNTWVRKTEGIRDEVSLSMEREDCFG
jgi:hypothetical protein